MGLPQAQLAIGFRAHVDDGPLIVDRLDPAGAFPESLLGRASSRLRQVHTRVCVYINTHTHALYSRFGGLETVRPQPILIYTRIYIFIVSQCILAYTNIYTCIRYISRTGHEMPSSGSPLQPSKPICELLTNYMQQEPPKNATHRGKT